MVSDIHLGKEVVFRRQGIPIPDGPTTADLQKLKSLCQVLPVRDLWILGDLIHGELNTTLLQQITAWRVSLQSIQIHLVEGNHDQKDAEKLRALPVQCFEAGVLGSLRLIHSTGHNTDQDLSEVFSISSHLHPVARVYIGRHKAVRVPSFVLENRHLILPSFREFTGGLLIPPSKGKTLFPIIGGEVIKL